MASLIAEGSPADVLLLGTPHLANPGRDLINMRVDDVLAPHRQAEMEDLVSRLAAFEPTRICVEATPDRQGNLDELYARYRAGESEAQRGEIHQIAFRLARRQGLDGVHGIDDASPMEWKGIDDFLAADPEEAQRFEEWVRQAQDAAENESAELSRTPFGEFLLAMNDPARLRSDAAWYVDMAGLGAVGENPGAEMLVSWYRRNIAIFANLCGVTQPGDRIFVLFGAGHIPILRELVELSSRHRLVEPARYLR